MVFVELRQAAYGKAFDLMESAMEHEKELKMTLCALEDAIEECYDASLDSEEEEYYEDMEIPADGEEYEETGLNKRARRLNSAMNRSMRMRGNRSGMSNGMRMRRSRRYRY